MVPTDISPSRVLKICAGILPRPAGLEAPAVPPVQRAVYSAHPQPSGARTLPQRQDPIASQSVGGGEGAHAPVLVAVQAAAQCGDPQGPVARFQNRVGVRGRKPLGRADHADVPGRRRFKPLPEVPTHRLPSGSARRQKTMALPNSCAVPKRSKRPPVRRSKPPPKVPIQSAPSADTAILRISP